MAYEKRDDMANLLLPSDNSLSSLSTDIAVSANTKHDTPCYGIDNGQYGADMMIASYLQMDEKQTMDNFFLSHGIDITQNQLANLLVLIVKQQHVVLTNDFFRILTNAEDDGTLQDFFIHMTTDNVAGCNNDSERMIDERTFEKWLFSKNAQGDNKIAKLYLYIKSVYQRYRDYEYNWSLSRLEKMVRQQSEKIDKLCALLAAKNPESQTPWLPSSNATLPAYLTGEMNDSRFSDTNLDFYDIGHI